MTTLFEEYPAPTNEHIDSMFEAWWGAYPRKVGKGKAKEKWRKLAKDGKLPPLNILIEATKRYCASDTVARGYVANPATWLNQERWHDENVAAPVAAQADRCQVCGVLGSNLSVCPMDEPRCPLLVSDL